MKHWFDLAFHHRTAAALAALHPRFDAGRYLAVALDGLDALELMDRLRHTAEAFHHALPLPFAEQLGVLRAHAPTIGHNFIAIWPCAHVAAHGLEAPALALPALRELTRHGSAEFAIRPFLARDLPGTLAVLQDWARDPDEHVRRLASEGSRPRLPWGQALQSLIADPSPTLPLLATLRADDSPYVRKSVANHLNDITKDHPEIVLDLVAGWDRRDARTAWIVRHALRTLVKRGHPRALALLGAGAAPKLAAALEARPARLRLGQTLTLAATLRSTAARGEQELIVDYAIHYARASGRPSRKVFKWKQVRLAAGETLVLTKRQTIRDFSTRKHHPGRHLVELQINGRR
ncbi:MAG: DNA alkylation repair protein, partial [Opitutaceae bacterium]|nr:DNA alkylation repair protein [Opitutaceae bacterium]